MATKKKVMSKKKASKKKTSRTAPHSKKKKKVVRKKKKKTAKKKKVVNKRRLTPGHKKKRVKKDLPVNPPRSFKGKMSGRPTKYGAEFLKLAEDYYTDHMKYGDVVPTIAGLAYLSGVARKTLYEWASHDDKKQFRNMLEDLLAKQENMLEQDGLVGRFNSAITKLMLAQHGLADKSDVGLHGPDDGPIRMITRTIIDPKGK